MPWESEVEREEEHHSETKSITITLQSGWFVFEYTKIEDDAKVERYAFAKGEKVSFSCKIKNTSNVKDKCHFMIIDTDTSEVLADKLFDLVAGGVMDYGHYPLGDMPDRDWHLHFSVAP